MVSEGMRARVMLCCFGPLAKIGAAGAYVGGALARTLHPQFDRNGRAATERREAQKPRFRLLKGFTFAYH